MSDSYDYTLSALGYLGGRVTDLFTSGISPTTPEKNAQTDGNNARNRLYAENATLGQGFSGEYTAPVLVDGVIENFVGVPHAKIMEFIDSIKLTEMSNSVQSWKDLATDTTTKATAFHDNIAKEMQRGWSGSAADSALASVKSYLGDVHKVDQAASLIANKMEEAYTGFQQVYYQVPQPSEGRSGGILASGVNIVANSVLPGAGGVTGWFISGTDERRAQNAENKANEIMQTVYRPVALQADTKVPKVPLPVTPQAKPNGEIPDNDGDGNGNGSGNPNGTTPNGTNPNTNPASTTENPATTTENPDDTTTDDNDDDTSTNPSSTTPQSTTPETTNPTTPNGTNPAGTNPAGTNPTGSGGPGSGSPGSGTPGAGKSIPGTGQQNPTAAGAGTTAAAGTARSGMSGMGGMGAPGRGGGKEDESEHNAPDWLRRVYEELLGPDEKHVPPVIGGDA
ncbi:PPE domain-containing protein [Nocardia thailandica]|uniref:PPE domain-containing protein n=1 Tax=Nocardia thailandica TaxID=257275 RepID=UPI0003059AED|nr:PPE domain-containing protein [Nocardia thailandica]